MQSQRVHVTGRQTPLLIAHRGRMLPSELAATLVPSEACAALSTLPPDGIAALVDAWGHRFPNAREPQLAQRVVAYVRERVSTGALVVVRR